MTERERIGNWSQTISGRMFYPMDPRAEDVDIEDIAHALSFVCRFGGHSQKFYSVAEHSVRVSDAIQQSNGSKADAFFGLLHDAAEAYIGDMIWPLKQSPLVVGYREIERRVEDAIALRFALLLEQPPIVKHFDLVLLATEKRDLMNRPDRSGGARREQAAAAAKLGAWHCDVVEALTEKIKPWTSSEAKVRFLDRFVELGGIRPSEDTFIPMRG